jgi:hypothetical protein
VRLTALLERMERSAPSDRAQADGARHPSSEAETGCWTAWQRNRFGVTESYANYVDAERVGAEPEQLALIAAAAQREIVEGPVEQLIADWHPSPANLTDVLRVLASEWDGQYPDIHFDLRCPSSIQVAVPEAVVRAVLYEVLENAAEALKGDDAGIVQVSVTVESPEILIDVLDNGPGLPAEAHGRRIFLPGWTTRGENRGSGLSRVRQLLRIFSTQVVEADVAVWDTVHMTLTGAAIRLVLPEHER